MSTFNPGATVAALFKAAMVASPTSDIVPGATALDVALLTAGQLTSCPKCIAEPGCNIDCDVCRVIGQCMQEPRRW